ncbi:MAG: bifunctional DNA primase/polymerase [Pseudomonadota bacterium]
MTAPKNAALQQSRTTDQAASGRPIGVGYPTFAQAAAELLDNGYEPLPIVPGKKFPPLPRWTAVGIDERAIEAWIPQYAAHGVGLRTGRLIGLDIDVTDPDRSHEIFRLATARFGHTLLRIGRWPKRLLLYRAVEPGPKRKLATIEVLGQGQQLVAFGIHPDTDRPYEWPLGETPLEVPLCDLPGVTPDDLDAFLAEVAALFPDQQEQRASRRGSTPDGNRTEAAGPQRDASGRVVDGRDSWLSTIAFHAVHDALDAGMEPDTKELAVLVWERFAATTELDRPRSAGGSPYCPADALRKIGDKLRLHREGRLPPRACRTVAPPAIPDALPVDIARARLGETVSDACSRILDWHRHPVETPPRIGIRATVGLGKSAAARKHLIALQERLRAAALPCRIAVFTPSHALAEEAAAEWRRAGSRVAVHRGYRARDPRTREPLCRDPEAVDIAIEAGLDVHQAACESRNGQRCSFFDTCLKQANRRAVAEADVVVAAYDALFTGFAVGTSEFGALLIDEACWQRARRDPDRIALERFGVEGLPGRGRRGGLHVDTGMVDLAAIRGRVANGLLASEVGPVSRASILRTGVTAEDCRLATALERRRIDDPRLEPGAPPDAREAAKAVAASNARAQRNIRFWRTLAAFLERGEEASGRLLVSVKKAAEVMVEGIHGFHKTFVDVPILHLDATLRRSLAEAVLPGVEAKTIEASASHMHLRLVTGGFGKSALIESPHAAPKENARRRSKLRDCVDYVSWQAQRAGRTLVITYKDCEAAFRSLPDVETAHFNAIAGLDCWRDVALLILIGRPLPSNSEASAIAGAIFDRVSIGGYCRTKSGILMRDGTVRAVSTLAHENEDAETIRAAICDDELIQAIGRGRGVNRTAENPLEVQLLADVALPLVHDRLVPWRLVAPDPLQRMLLAGLALDSPKDAAQLHPTLFASEKQAQKELERAGFKRHSPIEVSYRDLSLKSAAYRRPGRGCSWATAYWLDGDDNAALETLTHALGPLAEWRPRRA